MESQIFKTLQVMSARAIAASVLALACPLVNSSWWNIRPKANRRNTEVGLNPAFPYGQVELWRLGQSGVRDCR